MGKISTRFLSAVLSLLVLFGALSTAIGAIVDYTHDSSTTSDNYYNLVSKKDWTIAPGIEETEIVLDNDLGTRRQVCHIMVADVTNPYVKVTTSYTNMDTSVYATSNMLEQAVAAEEKLGWNVVGGMNTCLSWYDGYPADHKNEPLGFMMIDGETVWDLTQKYGTLGFPTCVVINSDDRPAGMAKVEMKSITSTADLTGYEEQVIPCSSDFIVKNGCNMYSETNAHSADNTNSAPRSVVGITSDGKVVIMENDGRQSFSVGMGMYECAEMMLNLGCVYACNCDGGGSSTFVSQRPGEELAIVNSPSDGSPRETTSGILFVSTAPSDGQFAIAHISTEDDYYTPYSTVTFNAIGTDLVGTSTEIPGSVTWQIKEPGMGTIDNGVFVSNGTTGTVTAQMIYNGNVVGESSVTIVIPEISFTASTFSVKYGTSSNLTVIGTTNNGVNEVVLKSSDYTITCDNSAIGSITGNVFTAVAESNAPSSADERKGTLTATLNYGTNIKATAKVVICKEITEILYDWDSGIDTWNVWEIGKDTYAQRGDEYYVESASISNGEVHDGTGSLKLYTNQLTAKVFDGSKDYYQLCLYPETSSILSDVQSYGVWVYINDEAYAHEFNFRYFIDSNNDGIFDTVKSTTPYSTLKTYETIEESGWVYLQVDVGGKTIMIPGADIATRTDVASNLKTVPNYCRTIHILAYPHTSNPILRTGTVNGKYTYYFDSFTVDYATEVADRTAPVFGTITLLSESGSNDQTMVYGRSKNDSTFMPLSVVNTTDNILDISANVSDAGDGLNGTTAKVFVDGKAVDCTYSNGKINISGVAVSDGVHRIKFEICDRAGNKAVALRLVNVSSGVDASTVIVEPEDKTLTKLLCGSIYRMNLKATDIETVQSVKTVIDINSSNHWELDHMELADGFTAEYTVDEETNTATITITRTGDNNQSGEAVLASLPIRIISFAEDIRYPGLNEQTYWSTSNAHFWAQDLKVDVDYGEITYVSGYYANTTGTFSNESFSVSTEMYKPYNYMTGEELSASTGLHVHNAQAMQDVAATCTEDGYSGRTYCAECDSVVDWGVTIPHTGHSYDFAEGLLKCECGELYNGTYTDGKFYVNGSVINDGWYDDTYYFIDGVKVVGQLLIEGTMCTFDKDGVYQPGYSYTGFYYDGIGWTYYTSNFQRKGFVVIDGNTHYFDDKTGYAPIGSFTLAGDRVYKVEGEKGKVLGGWDTFTVNNVERRRYYYSLRYYKNQWLEIDGETYYFNNDGYALIGKRAISHGGVYIGAYEFDSDGKLISPITGPFVDSENLCMYFAENGVIVTNRLVKYGNDYYFARSNSLLITWATYLNEEQTGGLLPAGEYKFGSDGKLQMLSGPVADTYNSEYLNFYINGIRVYEEGLYEYDGNYYYVRANGLLLTWGKYITKTNDLLPAGEYKFGSDGKLLMLNGPVVDAYNSDYLNFYINGVRVYEEGLYEYEGNYYYVRANGLLLTWGKYITKTNDLLPAGEYTFGSDGKLQMLNGPVADAYNSDYLNFYINGVRVYEEGLYEYEGNYYYVRANGLLLTWDKYITKTNGLVPAGEYKFGSDGKMIK